jgi:hypothetical protein
MISNAGKPMVSKSRREVVRKRLSNLARFIEVPPGAY